MANIKREQDLTSCDDFPSRALSFDSTGFQRLFGRNSSSAMPALGSSSHTYEPAFIETDFTTPLTTLDRSRHVTSAPPPSFSRRNPQVPQTYQQVSVMTPADSQRFVPTLNEFRQSCYAVPNANPSTAVQGNILQRQSLLAVNPPNYPGRRVRQFSLPNQNLAHEMGRTTTRQGIVARDVAFRQTDAVSLLRDASSAQKLIQLSPSEPKQTIVIGTHQGSAGLQRQPTLLTARRTSNPGTSFQSILPKPSPHLVVTQAVALAEVGKQFSSSLLHESTKLVPSAHKNSIKLESNIPSKLSHTVLSGPVSSSEAQLNDRNKFLCRSEPTNIASRSPAVVLAEDLHASDVVLDCSKKSLSNDVATVITETPSTPSQNNVSLSFHDELKFDDVILERPSSRASGSLEESGNGQFSNFSSRLEGLSMDATFESVTSKGHSGASDNKPSEDYEGHRPLVERRRSMEGTNVRSCMSALSLTAEGEFEEERVFVWDDYLEDTKSTAASATSFKHVECSIQSGFEKGMKLEIANKTPEGSFWVGSILMTCGQLLRMRPEGCGDDASTDFWCDTLSREVHQLGWCHENDRVLSPSEELRQKFPALNWETILKTSVKDAKTPPFYMLDKGTGPLPIDQIKTGMFLEVQLDLQPNCVWPVKVIENVGGRLLLRYESMETAADDFWLYYLHPRVHLVGWGKENGCLYQPPEVIASKNVDFDWTSHLEQNLESFQKNQPPPEIFEDQAKLQKHSFVEGWMLEAVHPRTLSTIHPATVKRIINEFFFVVELILTDEPEPIQFGCHSGSANVFPVGWCSANNVTLYGTDFDWTKYLNEHSSEPAPNEVFNMMTDCESLGFEVGMKLEAVNPGQPGQICAATITRVINGVMWLHLDHNPPSVPDHIVPLDTFDIFPIGWCESNECPLKTPKLTATRRLATVQAERHLENEARSALYMQMKEADLKKSSGWCPKIYFNYRCFTGRYLSKGRLVLLPRSVGPGPVVLVMTTVLTKLIKVAYKSSRVLRELQLKGKPNPNMKQQVLKAKYKGKSYSATVEICDTSDQITNFCRDVCRRLECCPNLISPNSYNTICPDNCLRLAKGKYPYNFGQKKRKIGRPPGGHSNLDFGVKKPGKRRKHRKLLLTLRKKHGLVGRVSSPGDDEEMESNSTGSWKCLMENDDESRDSRESVLRVSRKRREPCVTDMQMRGLKRPRYSFDRRTHKKVLHATQASNSKEEMTSIPAQVPKSEEILQLASNPLYWTVQEVVEYIKTTDCAGIARLFKEQEIDGQSLLLLSLPTVQEHLEPKLGPAVKLCHQIERLKVTFYQKFAL